jgi:DNA-binding beta-propeller fold protein YncE
VPGTAANGNSVQSIDVATGSLGTPIPVGSDPSILAISDDSSRLYVGLRGSAAIRPIDLANDSVGDAFGISTPAGAAFATDIEFQPGRSDTVAVLAKGTSFGQTYGPFIFDDGVRRPNDGGYTGADALFWKSPSVLVAYTVGSFGSVYSYAVDAQGATSGSYDAGELGSPADLVRVGNLAYNRGGQVYDAATLALIGTFPLAGQAESSPSFFGPAVDPASKRAYFVEFDFGGIARLHAYNTDTFVETGSRRIAGLTLPDSVPNTTQILRVTRVGANGLAFRLNDQVVFIDDLSGL